ncbi:alkaline phosphatase family protein [Dyella sp. GSA-30]|uniref:alkaline phosphatase family protein n=1 Tax=Dyella sp. GSA-30 TaxID=2994496 RepID=UPI002490C055|nr:alkaline phosphatase family protein [Dyella sp. GSA-30]BDU22254.1 hypothetical protein DYGSA30_37110 [Dyella sp. GSA-30]
MKMKKIACAAVLCVLGGSAFASSSHTDQIGEGPIPKGIPKLDHVFVIMMENHGAAQLLNNPNAPFINQYLHQANYGANYFAIAHPSLTNYLEVTGGSNFGIHSDNSPEWHSSTCITNLQSGTANTEHPKSPKICPIGGTGTDAETPAIDLTNETQGAPGTVNIDGKQSIPASKHTVGKSIADQLAAAKMTYRSYQESLPASGADHVNSSDGVFTNRTDFDAMTSKIDPPLSKKDIVALYAVKHDPFAYFKSTQEGTDPLNTLANTVPFDGSHGLYADLASDQVPNFSFIVPNQCHDMHGRDNVSRLCAYDSSNDGTAEGLNPALIRAGDTSVETIVNAIKASKTWQSGHDAIVVVWDENDEAKAPNPNQVLLIVDTNYGSRGVVSQTRYSHFSLLKTLESGFGLPCLNHACDASTNTMTDLFKAP